MPEEDSVSEEGEEEVKAWLGLTRKRRYKIYAWSALAFVVGFVIWMISYLRPWRWDSYKDDIAIQKVALDVNPGFVIWDKAKAVSEVNASDSYIDQTVISSDGTRMIYASSIDGNNKHATLT